MFNNLHKIESSTDEVTEKIIRKDDEKSKERIRNALDISRIAIDLNNEVSGTITIDAEAIESLARLVIELEDKLADYDTILSDDISGRLPSNFLRLIINKERQKKGKPPVKLFYVAAGRHGEKDVYDAIKKFLKEKKDLGKVLLSTEFISSGYGMSKIIDILEDLKIDFDLSAVSVNNLDPYDRYDPKIASRLYFGSTGRSGLNFHGRSGVRKDPIGDPDNPHPKRRRFYPQEEINNERKQISIIAEKISVLLDTEKTKEMQKLHH